MDAMIRGWGTGDRGQEALTAAQRSILVAVTLATAITRWLALAATPWDWDEMLFILAMRRYDVAAHHPHPPGFPLWIAFADAVHALGLDEFHALQCVAFVGAVAIVPAMFFLCRELRMRFSTSLAAAAILAFFPNVWFFGGTALSDVPSMTVVLVALALLFRGCRERWAYFGGAVVLAVAAGFRPQNLLIGLAPALLASAFQKWRDVVVAALLGAAIVGASYGVAIEKTGWTEYRETVAAHSDYIAKTDSFRSAARPPLPRVFVDFFIRPYRVPPINVAVTLFATISFGAGLVKRRPHVLAMLAAFGPFCIFAWLMLDRFSASRFSIGYAPLIALLVADGIAIVARCEVIEAAIGTLLAGAMIVWAWPALSVVRTTTSPPVQAIEWIRAHVDRRTPLYVHLGMAPYAQALLPDRELRYVMTPPAQWAGGPTPLFLREDRGPTTFSRERGHLWWLTRQRYFDVSVTPVTARAAMRSGWYQEEGSGGARWRWMGGRAVVELPPARRRAHLLLSFYVPLDVLRAQPNVEVRLNGATVARVHATAPNLDIERDVDAKSDGPNELVIETDQTVQPPNDLRTLGLRLNALEWY
jgi:hypothetical protein